MIFMYYSTTLFSPPLSLPLVFFSHFIYKLISDYSYWFLTLPPIIVLSNWIRTIYLSLIIIMLIMFNNFCCWDKMSVYSHFLFPLLPLSLSETNNSRKKNRDEVTHPIFSVLLPPHFFLFLFSEFLCLCFSTSILPKYILCVNMVL